jgi:Tfp pilus assembly protein PilW
MVFSHISCARRRRQKAFTLVEYAVATSIGLLVLSTALVLWAYANRTCASLLGYVDLSSTSKNALDRVSQQIRNARTVESCSSSTLVLKVPESVGSNLSQLTLAYNPAQSVLTQTTRKSTGAQETLTLLTGCTNFEFSVFQRTPMSNTFSLHTNGWTTTTAKVIQMRWTCVRQITGDQNSIETQVSANVVMRNQ